MTRVPLLPKDVAELWGSQRRRRCLGESRNECQATVRVRVSDFFQKSFSAGFPELRFPGLQD